MLKIQILIDNPSSWIIPYANRLLLDLSNLGHIVKLIHRHEDVERGDILCILACEKIFKQLILNKHNLVVHESDLPKGKGWSPVTWQILERKNRIPVTLFEAVEELDAGPIYAQEYIDLEGNELLPEIKHKQGIITQNLIIDFVNHFPNVSSKFQTGEETFYPRRKPEHSILDINESIACQFDKLRVCDNDRYPAYFFYRNAKYIIKIYKEND